MLLDDLLLWKSSCLPRFLWQKQPPPFALTEAEPSNIPSSSSHLMMVDCLLTSSPCAERQLAAESDPNTPPSPSPSYLTLTMYATTLHDGSVCFLPPQATMFLQTRPRDNGRLGFFADFLYGLCRTTKTRRACILFGAMVGIFSSWASFFPAGSFSSRQGEQMGLMIISGPRPYVKT